MNGESTSMLAYKMRKLVAQYGDSQQLADAVRQLLEGERNMHAPGALQPSDEPRIMGPLRALANE